MNQLPENSFPTYDVTLVTSYVGNFSNIIFNRINQHDGAADSTQNVVHHPVNYWSRIRSRVL